MISLTVPGIPAPKGSMRAIARGGRGVLIPSDSDGAKKRLKAWDRAVKAAAASCELIHGAVWVSVVFKLARPSGHYGTGRNAGSLKPSAPTHPSVKPDADKLVRSTLDSLTGLAFEDDSRIVSLYVGKEYALHSGDEGAVIQVGAWTTEQPTPSLTRQAVCR